MKPATFALFVSTLLGSAIAAPVSTINASNLPRDVAHAIEQAGAANMMHVGGASSVVARDEAGVLTPVTKLLGGLLGGGDKATSAISKLDPATLKKIASKLPSDLTGKLSGLTSRQDSDVMGKIEDAISDLKKEMGGDLDFSDPEVIDKLKDAVGDLDLPTKRQSDDDLIDEIKGAVSDVEDEEGGDLDLTDPDTISKLLDKVMDLDIDLPTKRAETETIDDAALLKGALGLVKKLLGGTTGAVSDVTGKLPAGLGDAASSLTGAVGKTADSALSTVGARGEAVDPEAILKKLQSADPKEVMGLLKGLKGGDVGGAVDGLLGDVGKTVDGATGAVGKTAGGALKGLGLRDEAAVDPEAILKKLQSADPKEVMGLLKGLKGGDVGGAVDGLLGDVGKTVDGATGAVGKTAGGALKGLGLRDEAAADPEAILKKLQSADPEEIMGLLKGLKGGDLGGAVDGLLGSVGKTTEGLTGAVGKTAGGALKKLGARDEVVDPASILPALQAASPEAAKGLLKDLKKGVDGGDLGGAVDGLLGDVGKTAKGVTGAVGKTADGALKGLGARSAIDPDELVSAVKSGDMGALKKILSSAGVDDIGGAVDGILGSVGKGVGGITKSAGELTDGTLKSVGLRDESAASPDSGLIKDGVKGALGGVKGTVGDVLDTGKGLTGDALGAVDGLTKSAGDAVGTVKDGAKSAAGHII